MLSGTHLPGFAKVRFSPNMLLFKQEKELPVLPGSKSSKRKDLVPELSPLSTQPLVSWHPGGKIR